MTLTELRYIVAVAREGHFGRAAQTCFVSQPTLSVAIKKLERELGVTLFERGTQHVELTETGSLVAAQAQRVLREAAAIRDIAEQGKDPLAGTLRIGFIFTVGPYLLPHLIPALNDLAPRLKLDIAEGFTAQLRARLRAGELDVIVISLPFDEPTTETRAVYEEPFSVLLPAAHPWVVREAINVRDLAGEDLLLLGAGHCFRDQVLAACPECSSTHTTDNPAGARMEGSSLETIRHMVASGMGITVLPCTAVGAARYTQRLLSIKRFAEPIPKRTIAMAWRRSYPRRELLDMVQQAIVGSGLTCVDML